MLNLWGNRKQKELYFVMSNRGKTLCFLFIMCIFDAQKPDALHNQSAIDNAVCCLLSSQFFPPHTKEDDWQRRPRRLKNPSMDFRVLLPGPRCPHFHSLPLPNQFCAGTLLTQVKGLWSGSQCLCLHSGGRDGDTQGAGSINAPPPPHWGHGTIARFWMYLFYACSSAHTHACILCVWLCFCVYQASLQELKRQARAPGCWGADIDYQVLWSHCSVSTSGRKAGLVCRGASMAGGYRERQARGVKW